MLHKNSILCIFCDGHHTSSANIMPMGLIGPHLKSFELWTTAWTKQEHYPCSAGTTTNGNIVTDLIPTLRSTLLLPT